MRKNPLPDFRMPENNLNRALYPQEVADLLGINVYKVYQMTKPTLSGPAVLPRVPGLGRAVRIPRTAVEALLRGEAVSH